MRVVFDNNILISAGIFFDSLPAKALLKSYKNKHEVLASKLTLAELRATFLSSKFDKYISLSNRIDFCELFTDFSSIITPTISITACRDPKDNKFLELGLSGKADCIVTGDKDLLVLHPFRGISIITPRDFLMIDK